MDAAVIIDDPPLLVRIPEGDEIRAQIYAILESYKRTLQEDRRHLLDRYRFVDAARKVVGVGSVGTRAYVVLLEGPRRKRSPVPPGQGGGTLGAGGSPTVESIATSTTDTASWPGSA